jgi:hypothetical protein
MVNFVFEWSSIETRSFGLVQSPICTHSNPMFYFFRSSKSILWSKAIQHSQFIPGAKKPPSVSSWAIFFEWERVERGCRWRHCGVAVRYLILQCYNL